jgi:RNA polymerase sigma factor (sigma-70 family)
MGRSREFTAFTNNDLAEAYARTRNQQYKSELVFRYDALVISCCKKYRERRDYEDIVQEGRLAFLQALETYNPDVAKFSTLMVYYVKGKISHYIRDKSEIIRTPSWIMEHYQKEAVASAALEATFNRKPTLNELAYALGMTPKRLYDIHTKSPGCRECEELDLASNFTEYTEDSLTPSELSANIFGGKTHLDDHLFLDQEEKFYLKTASVSELMRTFKIGIFDAKKLKKLVNS